MIAQSDPSRLTADGWAVVTGIRKRVSDIRRSRGKRSDVNTVADGGDWIDLGCGSDKIAPTVVGVDILDLPGVDVIGPVPEVLRHFETASVDGVYSHHFLEHVEDLPSLLVEVRRIMKPGSRLIAVVPHFSNTHFYSDPTHRTHFGLYTFSYFAVDTLHRRKVPNYELLGASGALFELRAVTLHFDRSLRRPLTYIIGMLLQQATSRSIRLREWYEARLCWIFPCAEIRFEVRAIE